MNPELWLVIVLWLIGPMFLVAKFRRLGFTLGLLGLWVLFGVFVEAGWISCRPGFEPLRSLPAFFNGFGLYAIGWYVVFGLKELAMKRIRLRKTEGRGAKDA